MSPRERQYIGVDYSESPRQPAWYPLALLGVLFGAAYVSTSRTLSDIKRSRGK